MTQKLFLKELTQPLQVMQYFRKYKGCTLEECKNIIKSIPVEIMEGDPATIRKIKQDMEQLGSVCEVIDVKDEYDYVRKETTQEKLIKKYETRLATMKENRAASCDRLSDEENDHNDDLIRLTAEFIGDLKSIEIYSPAMAGF